MGQKSRTGNVLAYDPFEYFDVRYARPSDIEEFWKLSVAFLKESNLSDFTPNPLFKEFLPQVWGNPELMGVKFCTLVVFEKETGRIAGYAHLNWSADWTVERQGEVYQLYMDPEFRGTGASRVLAVAVSDMFDRWDCKVSYVECACGFEDDANEKMFFNLWKKNDYNYIGRMLVRFKD